MSEEQAHHQHESGKEEEVHVAHEPQHHSHTPHHKKKKNAPLMFFIGLGSILIIAVLAIVGWQVKQVWALSTSPNTLKVAKLFNIPIAQVNGSSVSYVDYVDDKQALTKFYGTQPVDAQKPTDQEVSDQVLSRLVANKLIEDLATRFKATISPDELAKARGDILAPFPDEATVNAQIGEKYGWTLEHYIDRIVKPYLLEQSVGKAFKESTETQDGKYDVEEAQARHILIRVDDKKTEAQAKKEASAIIKRVTVGKEDFAKLATELSDDTGSKAIGGLIDWFGKGKMVPEFENAVLALKPGEISPELVKSAYGYHIVKLEGKRTSRDFDIFMRDQITNANIKVVLPVHDPFQLIRDQIKQQAEAGSTIPQGDVVPAPTN